MNTTRATQTTAPETSGRTIPWASYYDTLVNVVTFGKARRLRSEIASKAPYQSGDRVLDVGCGTGEQAFLAKAVVGAQGVVMGMDASPNMVRIAEIKRNKLQLDVQFNVDLIERISQPDNFFDVVMNSLVMHHLPDSLQLDGVAEFYRVLKPGGRVYIVDMESVAGGSLFTRFKDLMIHLHGGRKAMSDNVQNMVPKFSKAGFQQIETGRINRQFAYLVASK